MEENKMDQVELSEECQCSDCGAVFLWRKHGNGGIVSKEELEEARCPACGERDLLFMAKKME